MLKPKSLFSKLLLSHAIVVLVTLLVLGGMFNYFLQHYLANRLEQQIQRVARTLATNALVKQSISLAATEVLDDVVRQIGQSAEADVIIVDTAGKVLASTAPHLSGNLVDRQEVKTVLGDQLFSRWGGSFLGVPSLTIGQPIKENTEVIGAVFVDTSVKGFQANLFRFRLFILYAALLAVVLAAILAFVLARSISRPILEMNRAAQALAQGRKTKKVNYQAEDELGVLVTVFNRSVTEIQNTLVQQQKLEEQRREIVANVSREFRAPVTSLQGFLELMQDGIIQEHEKSKYYSLMLQDTARLNRLVNDLLDLARFQAGQGKITPLPTNPGLLAEAVLVKLTPRAMEQEIQLRREVPSVLPDVLADKDRLEQILLNLFDNALRFTTEKGWIKIQITPGHAHTVFRVEDSGSGIPAEDLPFVFERFYKVDKSRSLDKGGTGLGLAIVKQLVEAHGGKIWVASEPNKGTVITFSIPNA